MSDSQIHSSTREFHGRHVHSVSTEIAGRTLTLETGRLAEQAGGAVLLTYGDTVLLATVVGAKPREGIDFFPLTVDYEERMYSAGKIPGSFFKREGRPTTTAILTARLTDRPLRPLFPEGYRNEVQVIITTFAIDMVNDPGPMSIIGASAALAISDIPFLGPVGGVQVGFIDGQLVINPEMADMANSRLDLVVAGTKDAVLMVEAGAEELTEDQLLDAVIAGHTVCKQLCDLQLALVELAGKPKKEFIPPPADTSLEESVAGYMGSRLREATTDSNKTKRDEQTQALKAEVLAHFTADEPEEELAARSKAVGEAFENLLYEEVAPDDPGKRRARRWAWAEGCSPDHRRCRDSPARPWHRPVHARPDPGADDHHARLAGRRAAAGRSRARDHQALHAPLQLPALLDRRGQADRGSPRRRDIGHGALAERSLLAVLPSKDEFPYTMRLVSETLSSNGSSSMASVCGSSLSLMDAGVPIKRPVAGVAMGLITKDDKWRVLTDIQGIEDHLGDMDFKVAGTSEGITGMQMDIKTTGITYDIMRAAFAQAREGRLFILDKMAEVMPTARQELSLFAPRIITMQINPEKIGALIGPGGKNIRGITDPPARRSMSRTMAACSYPPPMAMRPRPLSR